METIDINEIKQCLKDYFQGREEVEDIQLVTSPCRLPIWKLKPPTSGQYANKIILSNPFIYHKFYSCQKSQ